MQKHLLVTAMLAVALAQPSAAADNDKALKSRFEALWSRLSGQKISPDIATSNGRIEA